MSPDNHANYFLSTYEGISILNSSTFYAMSNCKDGGRRRTQNVGENDLGSTLRSYRKGGLNQNVGSFHTTNT